VRIIDLSLLVRALDDGRRHHPAASFRVFGCDNLTVAHRR
jgi:hypothetical protein